MSKVLIEVTQSDIDGGVKNSNCQCPIARAIRRKCEAFARIGVGSGLVWFDDAMDHKRTHHQHVFIGRFDNGDPVQPFTFELDVTGCEHYFKPESLL